MNNAFAYNFNIEKYRQDTGDLSIIENGAYRILLDEFYLTGGFLPDDIKKLQRIAKAQSVADRQAVQTVYKRFFTPRGDGYLTQKRAANTLMHISKVSEENRRNAKAKHNKIKEVSSATAEPSQERTDSQPITNNQVSDADASDSHESAPAKSAQEKKLNAKPKRKATAIADSFTADAAAEKLAADLKIGDLGARTTEFIDFWKGNGGTKADWQATFRNRLRQIAQYRAERAGRGQGHTGHGGQASKGIVGIASELIRDIQNQRENEQSNGNS